LKRALVGIIIALTIISVFSISSISAQSQIDIPAWVKGVASFWVEGNISDGEFAESLSFLIEQNIIQVEMQDNGERSAEADKLFKENQQLKGDIKVLEDDISKLLKENKKLYQAIDEIRASQGNIIDSSPFNDPDLLDNGCTRDYPYLWSDGKCRNVLDSAYLDNGCPKTQPYLWSDGYCYNLSQFLDNGCERGYPYIWSDGLCHTIPEFVYDEPVDSTPTCDPSYPDVCIPSYPPDLDCDEIFYSNFRVVGSDPHGFDKDNDGIGCEVGSPSSSTPSCDPSYPDVCIPPYPPDLDCGEIGYSNFRVVGSDPHGFDRDNDGIGCES